MKPKVQHANIFVCFGIFRLIREIFTYWETSSFSVKNCKLWPISALMAIEQWRVYNHGNLWGHATITPVAERLTVELSLPVLTTWFCRGWDFEHPTFRMLVKRSNRLRHRRGPCKCKSFSGNGSWRLFSTFLYPYKALFKNKKQQQHITYYNKQYYKNVKYMYMKVAFGFGSE